MFDYLKKIALLFQQAIFATGKARQYYFRLEGYYYCPKKKRVLLILHTRGRRPVFSLPAQTLAHDARLLSEVHPVEACVVGIIANQERMGEIDPEIFGWQRARRFVSNVRPLKMKPLLKVVREEFNAKRERLLVLSLVEQTRQITISAKDLSRNKALLYGLAPQQACAVGYYQ